MWTVRPGSAKPILVLGLGNVLLQDDGFGPTLVDHLRQTWPNDDDIDFVDGGTVGLGLLSLFAERQAIVILDAFAAGQPPGSVVVLPDLAWDEAGSAPGRSAHEGNASSLLAVAALTGDLPPRLCVIGVEPATIATGVGLSPAVAAAMPKAERECRLLLRSLLGAVACA
jgi:hydrogenase maturation protease